MSNEKGQWRYAGIDVSDGLSIDLARLAAESGCGAVVETSAVLIAAAARQLTVQRPEGLSALEHALSDGEDFELLVVGGDELEGSGLGLLPVGRLAARHEPQRSQLWLVDAKGKRESLEPIGYQHLR
jgi:thiamine monophosphate kinase